MEAAGPPRAPSRRPCESGWNPQGECWGHCAVPHHAAPPSQAPKGCARAIGLLSQAGLGHEQHLNLLGGLGQGSLALAWVTRRCPGTGGPQANVTPPTCWPSPPGAWPSSSSS